MKYKEKLIELLQANDGTAFIDWIKSHEPQEQVEIMKQFKQMSLQNMFKTQDFRFSDNLKEFTKKIEAYEKAILAAIEVKETLQKIEEVREKALQRLVGASRENKQSIIDSIVNNEPDAAEKKALALAIIALEKGQNTYDADFWKAIE